MMAQEKYELPVFEPGKKEVIAEVLDAIDNLVETVENMEEKYPKSGVMDTFTKETILVMLAEELDTDFHNICKFRNEGGSE